MEVSSTKQAICTGVKLKVEVAFSASQAETEELRTALAVLHRWEKATLQAAKHNKYLADFTTFDFQVKTDKVIVNLTAGSCG